MTTARNQDVVFNSYIGYDYSLSLDSKIGCNLNNTPILNTYPTGPTSSKGTYIFDSNGSTKILTAGGTNDKAGITLDICSSTTAPYSVLTSNKNGTTVMKQLVTYDGVNNSSLSVDGLFFGGLNYKAKIDGHSQNIQDINNVTIPEINDRIIAEEIKSNQLDSRLTTNEELTSLHTSQIANLSAVDVVELAKLSDLDAVDQVLKSRLNVIETKQPIIISVPIYHVKSVYADSTGRADYIPSSVSDVTSYSGLYYKNNLNEKINWYLPNCNLRVGDIKALMLNFYNVSATTGLGCVFYNVYTKMDSLTPNAGSWYKSRKTFSVNYTDTVTTSTAYSLLTNLKNITYDPIAYNHTKINSSTIPANDKGTFSDSENILFFSVSTSSNSSAGLFEFIVSKFTIYTDLCSQEFNFQKL